jgi:hypothetical protein
MTLLLKGMEGQPGPVFPPNGGKFAEEKHIANSPL